MSNNNAFDPIELPYCNFLVLSDCLGFASWGSYCFENATKTTLPGGIVVDDIQYCLDLCPKGSYCPDRLEVVTCSKGNYCGLATSYETACPWGILSCPNEGTHIPISWVFIVSFSIMMAVVVLTYSRWAEYNINYLVDFRKKQLKREIDMNQSAEERARNDQKQALASME